MLNCVVYWCGAFEGKNFAGSIGYINLSWKVANNAGKSDDQRETVSPSECVFMFPTWEHFLLASE